MPLVQVQRRISTLISAGLILATTAVVAADEFESEIPKRSRQLITARLLPAHRAGIPATTASSARELLGELSAEHLAEANRSLNELGVPSIQELFATAVIDLMRTGSIEFLGELQPASLAAIIPVIRHELEHALSSAKDHRALKVPLDPPDNLPDFEQLFWQIHVLEQQIVAARQLQTFAAPLHEQALQVLRKATPEQQEVLALDFNFEAYQLQELQQQLAARKIEWRAERLKLANELLKRFADLRTHFEAAHSVDIDGRLLSEYLGTSARGKVQTTRDSVAANPPVAVSLEPGRLRQLIGESQTLAGPMLHKSRLFYEGVHWWLRGRYGRGTEGGGLLKPVLAYKSPELMFRLYMPSEVYTPPGTQQPLVQPDHVRRHQRNWSFEPNQLVRVDRRQRQSNSGQQIKITTQYFY